MESTSTICEQCKERRTTRGLLCGYCADENMRTGGVAPIHWRGHEIVPQQPGFGEGYMIVAPGFTAVVEHSDGAYKAHIRVGMMRSKNALSSSPQRALDEAAKHLQGLFEDLRDGMRDLLGEEP